MKILKTFCTLFIFPGLLISMAVNPAFADPASPLNRVKTTIDKVVEVVGKLPGDANKEKRREELRNIINPVFDFDEMSKRSLGTNWKEATPEEQKEFMEVFSNLLAKTYLGKIETIKPGMVSVDSENIEGSRAIVKSTIHGKTDNFPLDYKMQNTSGEWRVYDVVIENIGLVANYRNEFAGVVRKDKISGLIERLKNKKTE